MIDCINEEDSTSNETDEAIESNQDETFIQEDVDEAPIKARCRKPRAVRTKITPCPTPSGTSTPSKQQQQATALLEYVVDQKGTGSETLVVKSASVAGNNSPSNGSRRNSITGNNLSPRKSAAAPTSFSPFNPNYSAAPMTTQSHHLFPNYPRVNYNLGNPLPSLETQFDFNMINGGDLGLTALNVNDFNLLGIWNNNGITNGISNPVNNNINSYFNAYPQSDIPRYTQQQPSSQSNQQLNSHNAILSSVSQNPMNHIVSDLFGDISSMF